MNEILKSTCTKCGQSKALTDFYFDRRSKSHFSSCKECVKARVRENRLNKVDYRTALTRILRWARGNRFSVWSANPDIQRWDIEGDGAELFSALADAGFTINAHDSLVIDGERVRE